MRKLIDSIKKIFEIPEKPKSLIEKHNWISDFNKKNVVNYELFNQNILDYFEEEYYRLFNEFIEYSDNTEKYEILEKLGFELSDSIKTTEKIKEILPEIKNLILPKKCLEKYRHTLCYDYKETDKYSNYKVINYDLIKEINDNYNSLVNFCKEKETINSYPDGIYIIYPHTNSLQDRFSNPNPIFITFLSINYSGYFIILNNPRNEFNK